MAGPDLLAELERLRAENDALRQRLGTHVRASPTSGSLGLPPDVNLPCFVYGVFKPGELAVGQLESLLAAPPEPASVRGRLWLRDGLPLLEQGGADSIRGVLLRFREGDAPAAYGKIGDVEPRKQYRWAEADLVEPSVRANVVVGRKPTKGAVEAECPWWTSSDDPVLTTALEVVGASVAKDGRRPFESAPPDVFDWARMFRLQMAYLLLWSSIERYTALRFGPALDPMQRVGALGRDAVFGTELRRVVRDAREVVDSRNPETKCRLRADDPEGAIQYYYQVRSNLSHRGKGAWKDGETVRLSLIELLDVFRGLLRQHLPRR